MYMNLFL
jgi:hypothetical protein